MKLWHPTPDGVWQGRDDSAEGPRARRLFQSVTCSQSFSPVEYAGEIALLGFACDEGVRRNQGRTGAQQAPEVLRKALANMASQAGHERLVDLGTIYNHDDQLERSQQALHDAVLVCQGADMRTLVLGGGHETAWGHGHGVLDAFADKNVGIINLDAHLDLRRATQATSGTPFQQLANYCQQQQRPFNYACFGASLAANTQALWDEAKRLNATVVEDLTCHHAFTEQALPTLMAWIDSVDVIYLTIDLDVLPAAEMPAVSAPAALGVPFATLLRLIFPLLASGKVKAVDLVEFNPGFDRDGQGARLAARLAWQIIHQWR